MRQLDLFGSFFERPAKKEKQEDNQPTSKKESIAVVVVNEESRDLQIAATEELPAAETVTDTVEINETDDQTTIVQDPEETPASFPLPENISPPIHSPLTTISETTFELPISEADIEQQVFLQQDNEPKTDSFDENEQLIFEVEKNEIKLESELVISALKRKVDIKKEPQKRGRKSLDEIEAEADLIEVPEDEVLFKKQYYSISQVARWFRVNTSLLRFWEKEFDILKPKKNGKGDRLFRPEDVKNLQLIYQLLRERKYTIEGAKEYLKTNKKKADVEMQLTNTLKKFKSFLLDLKANL